MRGPSLILLALGFVVATVFFTGCKKGFADVDQKFTLDSFSDGRSLHGTKLDLGTVLAPIEIFFHDSLLFVTNYGPEKNISIYNQKNNHVYVGSIVPRGQGPDELQALYGMNFNPDGTFWTNDPMAGQVKRLEIHIGGDSVYARARSIVTLRWPVLNAFVLSNGTIGTTTQEIKPLKRFYVYDSLGNRKRETADYPSYGREIPPTALVEAFNGWVTVHPDKNRFLLAYELADLIEIYDEEFKLVRRVQGPHDFVPEFDLLPRGNSVAIRRRFDMTRFAYQGRSPANNKTIFLLYANGETVSKEDDQEKAAHFSKIVVVDWEGNPLSLYDLDHPVISICVDWKSHVIYGLDRMESEVYAFPF